MSCSILYSWKIHIPNPEHGTVQTQGESSSTITSIWDISSRYTYWLTQTKQLLIAITFPVILGLVKLTININSYTQSFTFSCFSQESQICSLCGCWKQEITNVAENTELNKTYRSISCVK